MVDNRTSDLAKVYGPGEVMPSKSGTKIPLREQHTMTYYKLDEKTGEIIEMPNLPADAIFYKRYLARGYVTDRSLLEERSARIIERNREIQPVEKSQEAQADKVVPLTVEEKEEPTVEEKAELICETCGQSAKNKAGLKAHIRIKHPNH